MTGRLADSADDLLAAPAGRPRRSAGCCRSWSGAAPRPARVGRLTHPLGGARLHGRHHRAPGAGKSTLTNALVGRVRGRRAHGGRARHRPVVAVLRRRHPRRPRADAGPHRATPASTSARWPPAATSAGCRWPRPRPSGCSTPSGWPWILIETVGVGQVEVEVAGAADTTVVVVNPGWGDAVQANKAGLLEIADVFVINKADRPGRGRDPARPRADARPHRPSAAGARRSWPPPRRPGDGVDELWSAIGAHRGHLEATGQLEPRRRRPGRRRARPHPGRARSTSGPWPRPATASPQLAAAVADRAVDPWTAAERAPRR